MKKGFWAKRVIAFALALTMLGNVPMDVSAAEKTSAKPQKTVGVEVKFGNNPYYFTNANGKRVLYTYVRKNPTVKAKGNLVYDANGNYLSDAASNTYSYNGVNYTTATYSESGDVTTFTGPAVVIGNTNNSGRQQYTTDGGYYSYNGKNYRTYSSTSVDYYNYVSKNNLCIFADGDISSSVYNSTTGFYEYNGSYYRSASYQANSDKTRFSQRVEVITGDKVSYDSDNFIVVNGKRYGTYWSTASYSFYFVYPADEVVASDASVEQNVYGYYQLNGKWYGSRTYRNNKCYYYGEVIPVGKRLYTSFYYDAGLGSYLFNGNYYSSVSTTAGVSTSDYVSNEIVVLKGGIAASSYSEMSQQLAAAKESFLKKANGTAATSSSYDYAQVDGKYYKCIATEYTYSSATGMYTGYVYAYPYNEIVFKENASPKVTWAAVPTLNDKYSSAGNEVEVYYQVEVNGKVINNPDQLQSTSGFKYILNDNSYIYATEGNYAELATIAVDSSVKVRVRAIFGVPYKYSYKNGVGNTITAERTKVLSVGAWSDAKSYTHKKTTVIKPEGFKASISGKTVDVKWTPNVKATQAVIYVLSSDTQIQGMDSAKFASYMSKTQEGTYKTYVLSTTVLDGLYSFDRTSSAFAYKYNYIAMRYSAVADGYTADDAYSQVSYVAGVKNDQIASITGLRFEKGTSAQYIYWDVKNVNSKVVVYAYTGKTLPKYSDAYVRSYKSANGTMLYSNLLGEDATNYRKTFYATADMSTGYISLSSFRNTKGESLEPGVKYNFVAYSYDTASYSEKKTPLVYNNRKYPYYYSVGKASKVISTTYNAVGFGITAVTTNDSVKLSFPTGSTGHIIYKKNAKGKFEKIATITNSSYVDSKLKKGQTYTYRVYNYKYNENTKKKVIGQKYYTLTATPGTVNNFELILSQAATNKVKLSWTKVPQATSYEIYKSQIKGDNTVSNPKADLNTAWSLVKTIKNAKTVTLTDTADPGSVTSYRVVAKYAVTGKQFEVEAQEKISMDLAAPERVKSSLSKGVAKFSWIANKYAKGYEVEYTIYDKYANPVNKEAKKINTKKNSVSIKGIPTGGYVKVKVKAYDSKNYYSGSVAATALSSLPTSKSISASYVAKQKAIKVSWKPVKGAKFYRVYRSTVDAKYDEAIKSYIANGTDIYAEGIEQSGTTYHQYYEVAGSITKTSIYDRTVLQPGVRYYYTVVAYNEKQSTYASERVTENSSRNYATTVYVSPKAASAVYAPYSLKINSIASTAGNSVTIKYNKVTGATSYKIYRSTKKNSGFELIGTSKSTTFKDKKVPKEGAYYYKVESIGENGLGADYTAKSAIKGFKYTKMPATPKIKSAAAAKVKGKAQITIKWSKVNDATGYYVYRSTSKNGKYTKVATIKKNATVSYVDKDKKLKAKTGYYYKVVAYRTANKTTVTGANSAVKGVKTK